MQQRVRKLHRGLRLRPPGNSPSRWHLTRGLLLCWPYDTPETVKSKAKMPENGNYDLPEFWTFGKLLLTYVTNAVTMEEKMTKKDCKTRRPVL